MPLDLDGLINLRNSQEGLRRVTNAGKPDASGAVNADPATLARQAGVSQEVYTLGRMFGSEGGAGDARQHVMTRIAQGQVIRTMAGNRSLTAFLTHQGKYGQQGKWGGIQAATSQDPTVSDIEIAKAVLENTAPDLAQGSKLTHFLSPWRPGASQGTYPPGHPQAGQKKPLKPFEDVLRSWANGGHAWVGHIPAVDSFRFMVFKKADKATAQSQLQKAIEMYRAGLQGNHGPAPWTAEAVAEVAAKGSGIIGVLALFGALGLLIYRRFYG